MTTRLRPFAGRRSSSSSCAAHSLMDTGLACGRCEVPICGRCMVHTPVGTRCDGCAGDDRGFRVRVGRRDPANPARLSERLGAITPRRALLGVGALVLVAALIKAWRAASLDPLIVCAIVYGGWVGSLSLHEYAHGLVAYLGGDRTIKQRGYLTLNPLQFIDPLRSLIMPVIFVLMGGMPFMGGATLVDSSRLRGRWARSAVSLAGPLTNLAIAGLIALAFTLGLVPEETAVAAGLAYLALMQVAVALFNLLPVPGLDGWGALAPHLSPETARKGDAVGAGGYLLLIMAFWTVPALGTVFYSIIDACTSRLGLSPYDIYIGAIGARLW